MHEPTSASTFPELLASAVAARPEHPAVIDRDGLLTYAELDRRSAQMARALLANGAGKGTRLALLAPDGALWLTTFYAALRIGALVTPLTTLGTPVELSHILRTSDAQLLIGVRRFLRHDYAATLEAALPGLADADAASLRLPSAPYLRRIWLDDDEVPWSRPIDELVAGDEPGSVDDELLAAVEAEVSPGDDAVVVYTSGSTAAPKAVVHRQSTVAAQPAVLASYFGIGAEDRVMPLLPAFWMGGIAYALQVLAAGGTLVHPPGPSIEDVLDTIERHSPTCVIVWHLQATLRAAAVERGIDIGAIRGLGAPVVDEHGERIPSRRRGNPLGMSETFSVHSAEPVGTPLPEGKQGAAGRAVNGIERRVVHPETGEVVAPGELGELHVRGGALMSGFYKVPREQVFTPDGFYATGDLVRIDVDGYASFEGRSGDMIKTSSANVSRLEVEAALNALPAVELSLVAALPDDEVGEVVAAAVVPAPGEPVTEAELRDALGEVLSSFKIPRRIVFISHEDVPRTTTGKVRLFELTTLIESHLHDRTRGDMAHGR